MTEQKKLAILIESHYDGTEPGAFEMFYRANGYEVDYISNLRGDAEKVFSNNDDPSKTIVVNKDISTVDLNQYKGLLLVGGYAMDMLRYEVNVYEGQPNEPEATKFVRQAMGMSHLIIGTICHSLWILTPAPDLLKGRKVTCGHNIMHDVINAGAELVFDNERNTLAAVHVDGNLVTSRHPYVIQDFMYKFLDELKAKEAAGVS